MPAMKLVALGDSITYGFPYEPLSSWTAVASRLLGVEIINRGVCGDTTRGMRARFHRDVVPVRPRYVIVTGGANDAFWGYPAPEIMANLAAICTEATKAAISPVLGLPTAVSDLRAEDTLGQLRRLLWHYAHDSGIPVLDFYTALLDPETGGIREKWHLDGAHPSREGYEVMGRTAAAGLEPLFARDSHPVLS